MVDYVRGNQDCYIYKLKWWHFLFPTIDEISTLCESHDRTYLFIVTVLRFIFYIFVFLFMYHQGYSNASSIYFMGYVAMIIFLVVSFISVINLFIKGQYIQKVFKKKPEDPLVHFPIKIVKPVPLTDAEIELSAILKAETDAQQELIGEVINTWRKKQDPHDEALFVHLKKLLNSF